MVLNVKGIDIYLMTLNDNRYCSKCGTVTSQRKKRIDSTDMWFYRNIRNIVVVSKDKVLREIQTKKTRRIKKRQLEFLRQVMNEVGSENLKFRKHIESRRGQMKSANNPI